jgi:phage terminase small subunit
MSQIGNAALERGGLNPQQRLFALEYLIDLNASAAAVRAGYAPGSASSHASALLKMPEVQDLIRDALKKREKKLELTAERVLEELMKLGFSDIRKVFDETGQLMNLSQLDDSTAAAVSGVKVKTRTRDDETETENEIKLWDKPKSLELLGKHLQLWKDLIDVKVEAMTDEEAAKRAVELYEKANSRKNAELPEKL